MNDILQRASSLSLEEQNFIVETLNKRIHEYRRNKIVRRVKEAEKNYGKGNVSKGKVSDLMSELDDD